MKKSLAVLLILLLTSCSGIFSIETIYDCSGELTMLAENGGKNKEATKMAFRLRKFRSIVDLWNKSDAWLDISFVNPKIMGDIYRNTEIRDDILYIHESNFDDSTGKYNGQFNFLSLGIDLHFNSEIHQKLGMDSYSGHCIERK